jgi:(1->4)-alpha-D-glucan 1-alpha-D-glucosylmutase
VCYVYNRFIAANDVGCSPAEFGVSVEEFHRGNLERSEQWPLSMLATSTHDTKRGEDVRVRMDVLSEMPQEWAAQVMRWRRRNRTRKPMIGDGRSVPDFNEEYFLYQTLVGAWPLASDAQTQEDFVRRIQTYMGKVVHEAKVNLSWINPSPEYIAALEAFIARILAPAEQHKPNLFLQELELFALPVQYFGAINSLAQVLIKIAAPGVPDLYQGNEIWDFSLVDPDNRRPVDFQKRQDMLREMLSGLPPRQANTGRVGDPGLAGDPGLDGAVPWSAADGAPRGDPERILPRLAQWLEKWSDGRLKLWTTMNALRFRREHVSLFQFGKYIPLFPAGEKREHVVAFAREYGGETALVAVPRLAYSLMSGEPVAPLADVWRMTEVPVPPGSGEFVNVLTGEALATVNGRSLLCREIFAHFPVALLAAR